MQLLDGRKAREFYIGKLEEKIKKLAFTPCLVIIQIGNRADSDSFIKSKKSFARKIGVTEIHVRLAEKVSEKEVIKNIEKYNRDKNAQGIIVQLPLPDHLNPNVIISNINPNKDVDGLTPQTIFMPATARGVRQLFDFYKIKLKGKKVTVVGQSELVGKPIAEMCRRQGAMVTVCDSKTKNLSEKTKKSQILVVAIGQPNFIDKKYISKGQIVIDVGITRIDDKLVGDVNFGEAKDIVSMITPVPGGVGQMTVLSLFENLVDACYSVKNYTS